jgi:hypothetical protein
MRESTPVPLCHNVFHALLKALSSFQPVPGAVFLRNSKCRCVNRQKMVMVQRLGLDNS